MNLSFGFAWAVGSVLDTSNYEVLYPADSSRKKVVREKNTTVPETNVYIAGFLHAAVRCPRDVRRILAPFS